MTYEGLLPACPTTWMPCARPSPPRAGHNPPQVGPSHPCWCHHTLVMLNSWRLNQAMLLCTKRRSFVIQQLVTHLVSSFQMPRSRLGISQTLLSRRLCRSLLKIQGPPHPPPTFLACTPAKIVVQGKTSKRVPLLRTTLLPYPFPNSLTSYLPLWASILRGR